MNFKRVLQKASTAALFGSFFACQEPKTEPHQSYEPYNGTIEYDSNLNLKEVLLDLFERDCIKNLNNHII